MTRFIKLSNMILNTHNIQKIIIHPNKFHIHLIGKYSDMFGLLICGSGFITDTPKETEIVVCQTENPANYRIISDWIKMSC